MKLAFVIALAVCSAFCSDFNPIYLGKNPAEWKSRIIYQVLTDRFGRATDDNATCNLGNYCGGCYQGIVNHLDYIQDLGMNAIWISPIVENTPGSYHGYHATNWYALNSNFGSENDFKNFLAECHKRDIWVMVDVVFNHVGPVGTDYSKINPFNDSSHYHSRCDINYNNQQSIEDCRLADLPDLAQENTYVRDELVKWANWLLQTYDIDGFRVDTVKHVPISFWEFLVPRVPTYMVGEVFSGDAKYIAQYTRVMPGQLHYPVYYVAEEVYGNRQSCYKIRESIDWVKSAGIDVSILASFISNHDNPRFLNRNGDWMALKNAYALVLLGDSIPIVYYGDERGFNGGGDPGCREPLWSVGYGKDHILYKFVAACSAARKKFTAPEDRQVERWIDDQIYAFSRGAVLVVTTNYGSNRGDLSRTITYLPFSSGMRVVDVLTGEQFTVGANGLALTIKNGDPRVIVPA